MAFDADQYVEALEPPAFVWKGRRFVGRVLSADEWILLHAQRDREQGVAGRRAVRESEIASAKDEPNEIAVERAVRAMMASARRHARRCITSWFPAPWWWRWVTWLLPGLNPAWRAFRQMPDSAQVEAIKDFSESQRRAMPESQPPGTTESTDETLDRRSDT